MMANCFSGTPMTHEDLINACTTSEAVATDGAKFPGTFKLGDQLPALQ
jgi:hypothetical protein